MSPSSKGRCCRYYVAGAMHWDIHKVPTSCTPQLKDLLI
jgi:hypothetical protein